jgi:hypothetical protein
VKKLEFENVGCIRFNSLEACKFFLRTFDLEKYIDEALEALKQAPPDHDHITCPIVSEYEVDKTLTFVILIAVTADALGLHSGAGAIFFADANNLAEVTKRRDKMANEVMGHLMRGPGLGIGKIIPTGKEKERA